MNPTETACVGLNRSHQAYFREQFAQHAEGGRLLGKMLEGLDLDDGRAWAIVPADRAAMAVADLETDAIRTDAEREAVAEAITRRVTPLLAAGRMLTIEYWTGTEGLGPSPAHAFKVGDSQFDYVTRSDSAEQVSRFLQAALWYPTVGVMVRIPAGVGLERTRELTVEQIEKVVDDVDLVLVGAWTADGYVFWEPNSRRGRDPGV